MDAVTIYEQPLNERMRLFLRLEHLFKQTDLALPGHAEWETRAAISGFIGIFELLSRFDLKTELLKELERIHATLSALRNAPGVDNTRLDDILSHLQSSRSQLHQSNGQIEQPLREIELLSALIQRGHIPGGNCNFDLPAYHHWLQQVPEQRITQLKQWYTGLNIINNPIKFILGLIRESTPPNEKIAEAGFYQQNLDSNTPFQLIRVFTAANANYYAEISAGKQRFSIRFMLPHLRERATQHNDDIPFQLCCCAQ